MSDSLVWLHLSDLHMCEIRSGANARPVLDSLVADLTRAWQENGLRPDFVLFTGDLAFGHVGDNPGERIADQFNQAEAFFARIRGAYTPPLPKNRFFIVPGNHDVDRSQIGVAEQHWLRGDHQNLDSIRQMVAGNRHALDWKRIMGRLGPYRNYLSEAGYDHLLGSQLSLCYARSFEASCGLRVGILGLNTAWMCAAEGEKKNLWMGGLEQIEQAIFCNREYAEADVRLVLLHHPVSWLSEFEDRVALRTRLRREAQFHLHGHDHDGWVEADSRGRVTVAAAACYDRDDKQNGYNLVRIRVADRRAEIWLREYASESQCWRARVVPGETNQFGVWPVELGWLQTRAIPVSPPHSTAAHIGGPAVRMTLELTGTTDLLASLFRDITPVVVALRTLTGDPTLECREVNRGSLILEGRRDGVDKFIAAVSSGAARVIAGAEILGVRMLDADWVRPPFSAALDRLPIPIAPGLFVGRDDKLLELDDIWADSRTHVVQIVADGGIGKSSLVWHWLERLRREGWPNCAQAFGWSFYDQGLHEYATDSQEFLERAIAHFGLHGIELTVEQRKQAGLLGRAVGEAFARSGGLLILDGTEPLQHSPQVSEGRVRDVGLRALVQWLRISPPSLGGPRRLMVVTTRWPIPELLTAPEEGVRTIELRELTPEAGADLLAQFTLETAGSERRTLSFQPPGAKECLGLQPTRAEFLRVAEEYQGHALALILLASYLLARHDGNVAVRAQAVGLPLPGDGIRPARHALRVMRSYDGMFAADGSDQARACHQVLCLLGLFDRPAPLALIAAVRREGKIVGLTDALTDLSLKDACRELTRLGLLSNSGSREILTTHPLVREHYVRILCGDLDCGAREAHARIYRYLCRTTPTLPITLLEMEPLFQAVYHGCRAGLGPEVLASVYRARIQHGEAYASSRLGALGPLLAALSQFFQPKNWGCLVAQDRFAVEDQFYLLYESGGFLMDTQGYAVPSVKQSLDAGLELCVRHPGSDYEAPMLYRLWKYHFSRTELWHEAPAVADKISTLAINSNDPEVRLAALRAVTTTACMRGDFRQAVMAAEKGQTLLAGLLDRRERFFNPSELMAGSFGFSAIALCQLGFPCQAQSLCAEAIRTARSRGEPYGLALALCYDGWLHQILQDPRRVAERSDEAIALSVDRGFLFTLASARGSRGWALAATGDAERGLALMKQGLEAHRAIGSRLFTTFWLHQMARVEIRQQRPEAAVALADEALLASSASGERWWDAPIYLLKADHAQASGRMNDAEGYIRKALDVAAERQALWQELHAATRLVELLGNAGNARETLRNVYGRFTEGHELLQLRAALALLAS